MHIYRPSSPDEGVKKVFLVSPSHDEGAKKFFLMPSLHDERVKHILLSEKIRQENAIANPPKAEK